MGVEVLEGAGRWGIDPLLCCLAVTVSVSGKIAVCKDFCIAEHLILYTTGYSNFEDR